MIVGSLFYSGKPGLDSGALAPIPGASDFGTQFGLLPREKIELMVRRKMIQGLENIEATQYQPASLDLRLGSRAFRVPASFLPGGQRLVEDKLSVLRSADEEINLEGNGAVLERDCVYVIPLIEYLDLPDSISAIANPKSSTGRLDIFTRLITDKSDAFDRVARALSGAAVRRSLATQLQRSGAQRLETQSDPIPPVELAATGAH